MVILSSDLQVFFETKQWGRCFYIFGSESLEEKWGKRSGQAIFFPFQFRSCLSHKQHVICSAFPDCKFSGQTPRGEGKPEATRSCLRVMAKSASFWGSVPSSPFACTSKPHSLRSLFVLRRYVWFVKFLTLTAPQCEPAPWLTGWKGTLQEQSPAWGGWVTFNASSNPIPSSPLVWPRDVPQFCQRNVSVP